MKVYPEIIDSLTDILAHALAARKFTSGVDYQTFAGDQEKVFAVIYALGVIGEAAGNIPPPFRHEHPEVPWGQMIGLRNKVIHGYTGVNVIIIWKTVEQDLPDLIPKIEHLLQTLPLKS